MLFKEKEFGELKEKTKAHEKQVWEAHRDRDQFEEQIKDLQLQNQQLKHSRETQMHALDRDLAAKVSYITTLES